MLEAICPPACEAAPPETIALNVPGGVFAARVTPALGGRLTGLDLRIAGRTHQILYRGDRFDATEGWTGQAPILWPATGRTFLPGAMEPPTRGWLHDGQVFPMPIHGFARDQAWTLVSSRADDQSAQVMLTLADSSESRALYPFGFRFDMTYVLTAQALEIGHHVVASEDNAASMPFTIGNHITFAAPLIPGGDPHAMTIETPATAELMLDVHGRPVVEQPPVLEFSHCLSVGDLQPLRAYSLLGYGGQPWMRLSDPSGAVLMLSQRSSSPPDPRQVRFTIWGDIGQGFISPEPWLGRQNALASGEGLIRLSAGESFHWTIRIELSPDVRPRC